MRRVALIVLAGLLHAGAAQLARAESSLNEVTYRDALADHYVRYEYANDVLVAQDRDFTQGIGLTYGDRCVRASPLFLPLLGLGDADGRAYALLLQYDGFIPRDTDSPAVQLGDRPYATFLYLGHRMVSEDPARSLRLTSELDLGMIGPFVGGEWVQKQIHSATGNATPHGWHNQINNDLVADYRIELERTMLRPADAVELTTALAARLGTLRTGAGAEATLRVGILRPASDAGDKAGKAPREDPAAPLAYLYGQPHAWLVGYDATLQGGLLNQDSRYTISSGDVERVVTGLTVGFVLSRGRFAFQYEQTWISREHRQGDAHRWGLVNLTLRF